MENLRINYRKGRVRHYLVFTILWFVLGILSMIYNSAGFMQYGFIVFGLCYLVLFLHSKIVPYIVIENNEIKVNSIFAKTIPFSEIKSIKEFAGDFTIHTETGKVKILKNMMDTESHLKLKNFIKEISSKRKKQSH